MEDNAIERMTERAELSAIDASTASNIMLITGRKKGCRKAGQGR